MIIRIDRLGPCFSVSLILQRGTKPFIGIPPSNDPYSLVKPASLEIQYKLARQRFHPRSMAFHKHIFSVAKNSQLSQRRLNLRKLLAERGKRAPQPVCGHSFFDQLLNRAQANQIAEVIEAVSLVFSTGDETQTVPIVQLLSGL